MTQTIAWAVVARGAKIFIRTVSDTRRAAIINWLVSEQHLRITIFHTDDDVERMWNNFGQYVDCREVFISDTPSPVTPADQTHTEKTGEF